MSHFKEKKFEVSVQVVVSVLVFPPDILSFMSGVVTCRDGGGLQNHHFMDRRKCVKEAGIKNLNKKNKLG